MNVLVRTEQVLELSTVHPLGTTYREPEGDGPRRTVITIGHDDYVELGSPEEITVSVEPGNQLEKERDNG